MWDDSIVLTSGSIYVVLFEIMNEAIVLVACLSRYIFAPEYDISSVFLLGELGGVPIKFVKLILGLLISILFLSPLTVICTPFRYLPVYSCSRNLPYVTLFWLTRFYSHE